MQGRSRTRRRIAVLFHERDRGRDLAVYAVYHLASFWRQAGHDVIFLYGTREFIPADVIVVHIDLSVVPDKYLTFAARYPAAVNGRIKDIRKSTFSTNLIGPGASWDGPVIVKSDLNSAGRPERLLAEPTWMRRSQSALMAWRLLERLTGRRPPFATTRDYVLYDHLGLVPRRVFRDHRLVVEKFRPEVADSMYHTRIYQFLGDRFSCTRLVSREPIVNAASTLRTETVEPHPEIVAWRHRLGLDYGKLDYVVDGAEAILLDVNKTTGAARAEREEDLWVLRRDRAAGIESFLRNQL